MTAPTEIELKFEIPVEALRKLERSRLLRANRVLHKGNELLSVYFDTEKLKLRREGLSLRIRNINGRRFQTIKRDQSGNGGTFDARNEWETEINDKNLDLDAARATALEPLLTKKVCAALEPIFPTRVHRTVYSIGSDDSEIEVSIDKGRIETGRRSSSICEVELELKHGDFACAFPPGASDCQRGPCDTCYEE